ncbi:MAG: InlB B-repeat-containing protein [Treponemataceae bacterium]|nr:InlB B-repeat-containing protein [Treponemataceae bacterium]
MKSLCSLFLSLSIFLVLVCVGCDTGMQQNEKTDLVFSFRTPNFRLIQSNEDNPTLLIEACLVDYDEKTIQKTEKEISSGEAVSFQFLKIATNINIKVKIQVFVKGDESPSYTGESDWILTQAGTNKVSVMLEKVKQSLFEIIFNSMGGSEVPSQVLESGVVEKPENPTKEGYIFDDWYTSSSNGETLESVFDFDTPIEKDLTLYAKWTPISYTVKFDANNDNATGTMDAQNFTYDNATNLNKNAFEVENYGFVEWNTKSDGNGTAYLDEAEILNLTTENGAEITLYAQWQKIDTSIEVTFPSYNDPTNLISYDEESQTFTAEEGYDVYEWYINGDLQDENSNKFTLITTNMSSGGIYTVMLIVTTESGDMYSAEYQVTIIK